MKKGLYIIICFSLFLIMPSCKNQVSHNSDENNVSDSVFANIPIDTIQEANVQISKELYDKLFNLIDSNDSGELSDSEFKPQADLIKHKIDSLELLLSSIEKQTVKDYGNQLLNDLIQKKATRDN